MSIIDIVIEARQAIGMTVFTPASSKDILIVAINELERLQRDYDRLKEAYEKV